MHYLDGAWADILGWGFVLCALAALAFALVLLERRRGREALRAGGPIRLERGREWDLVMQRATRELARSPRVEALQADATVMIEAAEYAYNRMLAEYVRHCTAPAALPPAIEPAPEEPATMPQPETVDAPAVEREPLAA